MSILSNAFHSAIKANKHGRVWTNSASKFPNSHLPRDEQTLVPLAWSYSKNMVAVVVSQEAFISFERLITSEIHICYLLITAHCKSEQWTHILLIAEICLAHFHAREALCNDFPTFPQLQYPKADQSVKRGCNSIHPSTLPLCHEVHHLGSPNSSPLFVPSFYCDWANWQVIALKMSKPHV